jgi:hypothetical protein
VTHNLCSQHALQTTALGRLPCNTLYATGPTTVDCTEPVQRCVPYCAYAQHQPCVCGCACNQHPPGDAGVQASSGELVSQHCVKLGVATHTLLQLALHVLGALQQQRQQQQGEPACLSNDTTVVRHCNYAGAVCPQIPAAAAAMRESCRTVILQYGWDGEGCGWTSLQSWQACRNHIHSHDHLNTTKQSNAQPCAKRQPTVHITTISS